MPLLILLSACQTGHIVDKSENKVYWQTIDEVCNKIIQKLEGADATSFEVLDFLIESEIKIMDKDRTKVYIRETVIENANPRTFIKF